MQQVTGITGGGKAPFTQTTAPAGQFVLPLSYSNAPRTPYENNLQPIDQKLQEILNLPEAKTPAARGENLAKTNACLEQSYALLVEELKKCPDPEKPPVELAIRFCDVLRQYGQIVYTSGLDNNFPLARQIEFAALNAGDYSVGILDKMFNFPKSGLEKLDDFLKINVKSNPPFEFMDKHVLEHSVDFCTSRPALTNLSSHALFVLAYNRRWLNGSCRNCEDPNESPQTRGLRYTNLINTADKQLDFHLTQETKDEKWELDYNDKPGFFKFMMEHDPANKEKWKAAYDNNWVELERLANHDDGKIARAINKMSFDIKDPADREVQLRKAVDRHPTKEGIHYCILLNNLGRTIMDLTPPKLEEAEKLLTQAKAIVDVNRKNGVDNANFPSIDLNFQLIQAIRADSGAAILSDIQSVKNLVAEALNKLNASKLDEVKTLLSAARVFAQKYPKLLAFNSLEGTMKRIDAEAARILAEQKAKAEK